MIKMFLFFLPKRGLILLQRKKKFCIKKVIFQSFLLFVLHQPKNRSRKQQKMGEVVKNYSGDWKW